MKCSIQLIELTLQIETQLFDNQFSRAYEIAMRKGRCMEEIDFGHVDESLLKKGIIVAYYDNSKKKKIKLMVYPGSIIGDDINEIWKPTPDNISELFDKLEKQIASYFNREYGLDDFKLSCVVFAADIDVGSPSKVSDYIKILHSIGRVKCFSPLKRDEDGGKIKKENCFALKGNCCQANL